MKAWSLTLPSVEPIMFHFGLNEFDTIGETEYWISNEIAFGYCAKYIFIFKGQSCPPHHHKKKHETFFIVKGVASMRIIKDSLTLKEGDRLIVAPEEIHGFSGITNCLILEISMPSVSGDSFFVDKRIGCSGIL
jgi:mannose-6-phosphate isomerase-like protein (cupin superfamily)